MNNNPQVSILVPVYNVEKYIERCARSLFEQTYENLEYIFVDDGSTDESKTVLERIISEYPHREPHVQVFSFPENKGLPTVRNFLVDHCQTDWLMHVDSDDWIEHDLVEELVKKQLETGTDMVISGVYCHMKGSNYSRRFLDSDQKEDFLKLVFSSWDWNNVWGNLIRRSVYTDNNIHVSTGFYSGEDLRTIFHLTYHAKSIAWARKDGYHYDCSRTSRISDLNTKKLRKVYTGYVNSLAEARSFVAEKMPEYLELFDTGKCMTIHNLFLYNSFTFGDKELHGMAKAGIRDILRRYPSLQGSLLDRMKRELKYHYWIARPLIKWYGKCMTVIKGV